MTCLHFLRHTVALTSFARPVAMAQSARHLDLDAYVGRVMKTFEVPGISVAS